MPLPEKVSPSADDNERKLNSSPPPAPPVVEPVETVVDEQPKEEQTVEVRLAEDRQNRGPVTLSIAGLPKPIELEGSKSVKVPAMFAESLRLAPSVEIVEESR